MAKKETSKKQKKILTEKEVVDYIIDNWTRLMEEGLHYYGTEIYWLSDWRCDLTAYYNSVLGEEHGFKKPYNYRAPIFIEVKYKSNSRDLIYELQKGLKVVNSTRLPAHLAVISNDFSDPYIYDFIKDNGIHMLQIKIKDDDLKTLELKYIDVLDEDSVIQEKL